MTVMNTRTKKAAQEQPKPEAEAEQSKVENPETGANQEQVEQPEAAQEQPKPEAEAEQKTNGKNVKKGEINEAVDAILKLYPQYEKLYITSKGFVHPANAPKYLTEDAVLYENKYFIK